MRLRNKPWAKPLIEANPQYVVTEPEKFAGKWQGRFEKEQPIFVEVGTGKGRFIVEMAENILTEILSALKCRPLQSGLPLKSSLMPNFLIYSLFVQTEAG